MLKRDLAKAFGSILRKRRAAVKMSQETLSERADVDVKMIGMVERNVRNPSLNLADSLAHALGVPLWELVKDAEDLRGNQQGPTGRNARLRAGR